MQTPLVVRALKVPFPQDGHSFVVPPEEVCNDGIEHPSTRDMTPQRLGENIHGSHSRKRRKILRHTLIALGDIDRYHHQAPDHRQHQKDIPAHLRETDEDDGVQTDRFRQIRLPRLQDRLQPGE